MPKHVIVSLTSAAPYQQGRYVAEPKQPREDAQAYEERTWRYRATADPETGQLFIPPMALKKALESAVMLSGEKIKGGRGATYTKYFRAGVRCTNGPALPHTRDTVPGRWVMVPADGKPGPGPRVPRCFPTIDTWQGTAEFYLMDDIITREVFEKHLRIAGRLIGIGVWRVEKGGMHGLFEPTEFVWEDL